MASHLHKSLQEVQSQTTSSEFVEWCIFLEKDTNSFHREDWYMAQIAAEIRRVNSKHPDKVTVKGMLLKFTNEPQTVDKQKNMAQSKVFWAGILGGS